MSLFTRSIKKNGEPSHLRELNSDERFTIAEHLQTDGEHYYLQRNFRLSTLHEMSRMNGTFCDNAVVCYFADLINKFITDEGRDESKTSDEEVIKFFAYAYKHFKEIEYLDQDNAEEWVKNLIQFNPKFFNDKHLAHSYKYEIYLLFVKLAKQGLWVKYKEVEDEK